MKIGILQAGHLPDELVEEFGDMPKRYMELLDGNGFTFEIFPVVDGQFPESIEQCDGWLITGSRHGAYDALEWMPPLEALIRAAVSAGIPVTGTCFGHQIMAKALGGKVVKFDGGWAIGRMAYETPQGETLYLNAWHQDQVVEAPEGSKTVLSSAFCRHAGLAYGDNALSFQPHPEYGYDVIAALVRTRGKSVLPPDIAERGLASLEGPTDEGRLAAMMAQIYKKAAGEEAA